MERTQTKFFGNGIGSMTNSLLNPVVSILGKKMWIGDESVVLNQPSNYTAIALSKIWVLEISKKDFIEKFPTDIKWFMH